MAKEWLYWILEEDGRSNYVDDKNVPSTTVEKRPLRYTPDAWQDISLAFERDKKRLGIMKKVPIPIGFVLDGAKILRNAVYRSGLGKKLFLLITRRIINFSEDPTYFKDYQTKFCRHEIELVSQSDSEEKYTATLTETGLAKKIAAGQDTKFEFPLSDPEAVTLRYVGLKLYNTANYIPTADAEVDDSVFGRVLTAPISFINEDGNSFGAAFFSQNPQAISAGVRGQQAKYMNESQNYLLSVDDGSNQINFDITGKIKLEVTKNNIGASLGFYIATNRRPEFFVGGTVDNQPVRIGSVPTGTVGYHEIDVNVSLLMHPGEHAFIISEVKSTTLGTGFKYHFIEGGTLKISYGNSYRDTNVRCFEPDVLMDKLLEKMCGQRGRSVSALLSGKYKGYLLTSGDGVRGLVDAKVKLSYNEFFDIYYVNTFGSMGVENETLRFEVIDYFLDKTPPAIDLGEASDCKVTCPKELLGNTIKIGHKVKDIGGVNGKLSFNNTHLYSTPAEEVITEIPLVSPAIADPYAAEHVRAQFDGKDTTNSDNDNDLFLLISEKDNISFRSGELIDNSPYSYFFFSSPAAFADKEFFVPGARFVVTGTTLNNGTYTVKSVIDAASNTFNVIVEEPVVTEVALNIQVEFVIYKLKRYAWTAIEGVPFDSRIFNTDVTPKSLLILWRRWLNSVLWKREGKNMKFESTEQNADLKLTLGSLVITEKGDLEITTAIMWKPFNFEIDTLVPTDIFNTLELFPNRMFSFVWNNAPFSGFIWVGGVAPDNNKPQAYKILCSPDCDLTPLID